MIKGLEALKELNIKLCENCPYNKPNMDGDVCSKCEEKSNIIEKELQDLEFIKKCFYVSSSGGVLKTDFGDENIEKLKEILK